MFLGVFVEVGVGDIGDLSASLGSHKNDLNFFLMFSCGSKN